MTPTRNLADALPKNPAELHTHRVAHKVITGLSDDPDAPA